MLTGHTHSARKNWGRAAGSALFDNINFNPTVPQNATQFAAAAFQATSAYRDPDNTFDPGGRLGQLVFRLNW